MRLGILIASILIMLSFSACKTKIDQFVVKTQTNEGASVVQTPASENKLTNNNGATSDLYESNTLDYTIQKGDTIFSISEKFNLEPYSVLWANLSIADKLHNLPEGKIIRIPPLNGYYYVWQKNDNFNDVAKESGGNIQEILKWNHGVINGSFPDISIDTGTEIFIPNGSPEFTDINNFVQ